MDMEKNDSWSPGDRSSSVVRPVSALSVTESFIEASSSPISGSVAEAFSECSDNPEFLNEPIHVNGTTLVLPSDLCSNSHLLKSILTMENITNCIQAEDLESIFVSICTYFENNLAIFSTKTLMTFLNQGVSAYVILSNLDEKLVMAT